MLLISWNISLKNLLMHLKRFLTNSDQRFKKHKMWKKNWTKKKKLSWYDELNIYEV